MPTQNTSRTLFVSTLCLGLLSPCLALAADLDNDGYEDLLVGIHRLDAGGLVDSGTAAILDGSSVGLLGNSLLAPQLQAGARAGFAVAAGDFDGDGMLDSVVGASLDDSLYYSDLGAVFVLPGDGSFSTTLVREHFVEEGTIIEDGDHFGRALAVGDFNGDGYDDLAIGAPRARDPEGGRGGIVYVAYGSAQGLVTGSGSNNRLDANTLDDEGARFGFALAAGDFNHDGQIDLAISAPTYRNPDGDRVGQVQIREYIGGESGFDPIDPQQSALDGTVAEGWFGWSLAGGTLDDDGLLDLAVGVPGYQNANLAGTVEIYLGEDLHTPAQILSELGLNGDARFGYALVTGDLDGDGVDELAVGAPQATLPNLPSEAGAVWIYTGGASLSPWAQVLSPTDFGGNNFGNGQKFGCSLAMGYYSDLVTDPNRRLDLAVGAKRAKDDNGIRSGAVFMYGNDAGPVLVAETKNSLEDVGWSSEAGALFGSSLAQ